jgi:DtxR family Mn-dependent transcriptional regulator
MGPERGQSLGALAVNAPALIVHLEDEPPNLFAQLSAAGLHPGMKVFVRERSPQRLLLWADGRELRLPPFLANNVTVAPLPQVSPDEFLAEECLDAVAVGRTATVLGLSPACRGPERRRLLDLGFVQGTAVSVLMRSPVDDPTAYLVRGTTVALRREQSRLIRVRREQAAAA